MAGSLGELMWKSFKPCSLLFRLGSGMVVKYANLLEPGWMRGTEGAIAQGGYSSVRNSTMHYAMWPYKLSHFPSIFLDVGLYSCLFDVGCPEFV